MKLLLKLFIGGITFFLLSFVTIYLFTSGDYYVQETVATNDSLNSITVNDNKIHFESLGDTLNPMLVILHGGPAFDSKYMKGFEKLSDDFHVVFYDQLGCGLSERVNHDEISMEIQIENLKNILSLFNNDTTYLLGHSWGAMLATAFVSSNPEKIEKLILIEPEYLTTETKDIFFENTNLMRPKFSFASFSFLAKNWFQSLHIEEPDNQASTDYMLGNYNAHIKSDWHPLRDAFCETGNDKFEMNRFGSVASASLVTSIFDNEGVFKSEIFENAKNYESQVLIIAGECNKINENTIQQKHAELFKKGSLETIPDAGFFVHLDKPEETYSIIKTFLKK